MKKVIHSIANSQRMLILMLILSSVAIAVMISLGTIALRYEAKIQSPLVSKEAHTYEAYYALVVENNEDIFWQSVYRSAKEVGKKSNILVELVGDGLLEKYSVEDKFRIAMASDVDGILVAPEGKDIEDLLDEAANKKIPVITLLDDSIKGERKSFIGMNSLETAKLYSQAVEKIGSHIEKALILVDTQEQLGSKNMMCLGISEALAKQGISVQVEPIDRKNTFSAEEMIRNTILSKRNRPDLMICLNTEDTLCAYQAVIDYNQVGNVQIMGYYQSDVLIQGIEKGIISSTLLVNSEQMGTQGVEALNSYRDQKQVNAYFTVDVTMINKENVADYLKEKGEYYGDF